LSGRSSATAQALQARCQQQGLQAVTKTSLLQASWTDSGNRQFVTQLQRQQWIGRAAVSNKMPGIGIQ
jgi:hypothetical protein